jgi:hypothetical protein
LYYTLAALLVCATTLTIVVATSQPEAESALEYRARFNDQGEMQHPAGFRRWVFVGAPVTPNGLNGGAAGFPEFHNVYVEPRAYDEYMLRGVWPTGTVIARELQLALPGDRNDGSRIEVSGRGYFPGRWNGLEVSVKDPQRFPDTNGWGFFSFGRDGPPYAKSAPEAPVAVCAGCHIASAHDDMVFSAFYRQLQPPEDAGETAVNE